MPLTSTLVSVSGSDLFGSTTSFASNLAASNYIELAGCSTYREANAVGLVYLTSVVNPGAVKTTNTFKYWLYAMQGGNRYLIANYTTGITFVSTELSTGVVNNIAIASVDTSTVQATTRYVVTF